MMETFAELTPVKEVTAAPSPTTRVSASISTASSSRSPDPEAGITEVPKADSPQEVMPQYSYPIKISKGSDDTDNEAASFQDSISSPISNRFALAPHSTTSSSGHRSKPGQQPNVTFGKLGSHAALFDPPVQESTPNYDISPAPSVATSMTELLIWDSPETIADSPLVIDEKRNSIVDVGTEREHVPIQESSPPLWLIIAAVGAIVEVVKVGNAAVQSCRGFRSRRPAVSDEQTRNLIQSTLQSLSDGGLLCQASLVACIVYLKRLGARDPKIVSYITIHRHILAAAIVANKICGDTYFPLQLYAKSCNVSTELLCTAELTLLKHLHFDVQVQPILLGRNHESRPNTSSTRFPGLAAASSVRALPDGDIMESVLRQPLIEGDHSSACDFQQTYRLLLQQASA